MVGTACLTKRLGDKGSGRYAIITVAHNFKQENYEFRSAKFVLYRNDKEYLARFTMKRQKCHELYQLSQDSIL